MQPKLSSGLNVPVMKKSQFKSHCFDVWRNNSCDFTTTDDWTRSFAFSHKSDDAVAVLCRNRTPPASFFAIITHYNYGRGSLRLQTDAPGLSCQGLKRTNAGIQDHIKTRRIAGERSETWRPVRCAPGETWWVSTAGPIPRNDKVTDKERPRGRKIGGGGGGCCVCLRGEPSSRPKHSDSGQVG